MSDIIKGQKLSNSDSKTLNELKNGSDSGKTFIPGIIKDIANVKIPIDSFILDSWKEWSERHGSSSAEGSENSYYIGSGNYVKKGVAFGDNNFADGSYNIGQGNSAKGGVYVIGNNNNANYEEKYDADGNIIDQNTNTVILGDNNYTENYIGEYSAIDQYTYDIDEGDGNVQHITAYSANFTGKTRSLIVGNNNSAIGWNQYSFGDKNFNGSTVYAYDPETSSYKTSGLKYRSYGTPTDFNDDLGYTLTFGRGNSAVRMFDMAIGLSSFASGGQNIAIGYGKNNIQGHNISSPDFTTTVKEGSRNIVYNSYLPGGYDNTLRNSYIDFGESGFYPMFQTRNHLEYSIINNKKQKALVVIIGGHVIIHCLIVLSVQ